MALKYVNIDSHAISVTVPIKTPDNFSGSCFDFFLGLSLYTQYQLLSEENKKTMDDSHHDSHHEDTIYSSTGLQFTITDYCFCQDYNYLTVAFQAHQKIRNFAMPYQ